MSFLKAEWRKLAIANYSVDPALLEPFVPAKTELDFWNGTCYASLVGFMFMNTRVMGIPVPFHINFEEVNLRFYVRFKDGGTWKRGVVFIKEIVPKHAITWVANTWYKEHYQTMPMWHQWAEKPESLAVAYGWKYAGQPHSFALTAENLAIDMAPGSEPEFITEHYWGYSQHGARTVEYEVTHPRWQHYPVLSHQIQADFGKLYGERFSLLNQQAPVSVMLAEGSAITVESRRWI